MVSEAQESSSFGSLCHGGIGLVRNGRAVVLVVLLSWSCTGPVTPGWATSRGCASVQHRVTTHVLFCSKNVPDYSASREKNDLGFITFDLVADMTPLFNWNVKQLFLYLTAEYMTSKNVSQLSLEQYDGRKEMMNHEVTDCTHLCILLAGNKPGCFVGQNYPAGRKRQTGLPEHEHQILLLG